TGPTRHSRTTLERPAVRTTFPVRLPWTADRVILLSVRSEESGVNPVTGRRMVDESVYSVEFKPRATGRRVIGMLTLAGVVATAYFAWRAYEERTTVDYGTAATIGALTIILWAAWAASPVTHLHVHGGILEVQRAGRTERFDL